MVYFTKGISLQAKNGRLRQLDGEFRHSMLTFEVDYLLLSRNLILTVFPLFNFLDSCFSLSHIWTIKAQSQRGNQQMSADPINMLHVGSTFHRLLKQPLSLQQPS